MRFLLILILTAFLDTCCSGTCVTYERDSLYLRPGIINQADYSFDNKYFKSSESPFGYFRSCFKSQFNKNSKEYELMLKSESKYVKSNFIYETSLGIIFGILLINGGTEPFLNKYVVWSSIPVCGLLVYGHYKNNKSSLKYLEDAVKIRNSNLNYVIEQSQKGLWTAEFEKKKSKLWIWVVLGIVGCTAVSIQYIMM